jgi:hypothetical protein
MNQLHAFSLYRLGLAVALAIASSLFGANDSGGFGIGPGMVMVENIHPGDGEVDVNKTTGFSFEVQNGTTDNHIFTISARPALGMISSWEIGYESIPDAKWLRLDKTEIEVAAKSTGKVNLFINIPGKPEYFNRKWMAVVACSPGKSDGKGSSVGLIVASRVQIETSSKDDADPATACDMCMVPSSWMMSDARPGDSWRKVFKLRNNTKEEHTYALKSISDLEKDPSRHDRYFGQGFTKLDKETWAEPKDKNFTLKPGEVKELTVMEKVSKNAEPGKRYEDLLFIQDEKGGANFIRLRTELPPVTASKDDEKKIP